MDKTGKTRLAFDRIDVIFQDSRIWPMAETVLAVAVSS